MANSDFPYLSFLEYSTDPGGYQSWQYSEEHRQPTFSGMRANFCVPLLNYGMQLYGPTTEDYISWRNSTELASHQVSHSPVIQYLSQPNHTWYPERGEFYDYPQSTSRNICQSTPSNPDLDLLDEIIAKKLEGNPAHNQPRPSDATNIFASQLNATCQNPSLVSELRAPQAKTWNEQNGGSVIISLNNEAVRRLDTPKLVTKNKKRVKIRFTCNQGECKKGFPDQWAYDRHMFTHTRISKYKCTECSPTKFFCQKYDLKQHQRIHEYLSLKT